MGGILRKVNLPLSADGGKTGIITLTQVSAPPVEMELAGGNKDPLQERARRTVHKKIQFEVLGKTLFFQCPRECWKKLLIS